MNKMIHNSRLQSCLKVLTRKAVNYYNKFFESNVALVDSSRIGLVLVRLEPEIQKLSEYSDSISLVTSDKKITGMLNQLVGTLSGRYGVGDANRVLLSFLEQFYIENRDFDSKKFDKKYADFEEFFYSDKLRFEDTAKLYNFSLEGDELDFGMGVRILKTMEPKESAENLLARHRYEPYTSFSKSGFVIQRNYSKKKIVGDISKQNKNKTKKELAESPELFDRVVTSLRILKSAGVYRDRVITSKTLTFSPISGVFSRFPFKDKTTFGDKCKVSKRECGEVVEIYKRLEKTQEKRFVVAVSRLEYGLEKDNEGDKLVDYMIGLEALYLPDTRQELAKQLALRVAFMLEEGGKRRREVFNFVNKMYGQRGGIVHGGKAVVKEKEVKKIESILRKSLKTWLEDQEQFSKPSLKHIYFK